MPFWMTKNPEVLEFGIKFHMMRTPVGGRFRLKKKIGQGCFGIVYIAKDTQTSKDVAVKLEAQKLIRHPQLRQEAKILSRLTGIVGITPALNDGREGDYAYMAMDLKGPSLKKFFETSGRSISLGTVILIGDQLVRILEGIHLRGVIHRDLKPGNLVMGLPGSAEEFQVHLIDFGLSREFIDRKSGFHQPVREGKSLTGTPRYASINNHKGIEPSRRDDMESLIYVLLQFGLGRLPWDNMQVPIVEGMGARERRRWRFQMIGKTKEETSIDSLLQSLPTEFGELLDYIRKLPYETEPDYAYFRATFEKIALRLSPLGFKGLEYEWKTKPETGARVAQLAEETVKASSGSKSSDFSVSLCSPQSIMEVDETKEANGH